MVPFYGKMTSVAEPNHVIWKPTRDSNPEVETFLPTKRETKRRNDYWSGHKKRIGLNVQALCDAQLRFLLISVLCPGKTNDWSAYGKSVMKQKVESLPDGFHILGDAAYVNSEHLLAHFQFLPKSTAHPH